MKLIEEHKQRSALRGAIFKFLITEFLKKAGRFLEYRSSVFSSDGIRPLWLLVSSPFQTCKCFDSSHSPEDCN